MPVPKRKLSRKRRDQRSANKGIKPKAVAACQTCQSPVMPHQVCRDCGYYKGKKILRTKADRLYARGLARESRELKMRSMQQNVENDGQLPAADGSGSKE